MAAGLGALGHDDIRAQRSRRARVGERLHLQDQPRSGGANRRTNGAGSPNDSMTATGLRASAARRRSGSRARCQVMKPIPTGAPITAANSRSIQAASS